MYKPMNEIDKDLVIAHCKKMIAMLESNTDWQHNNHGYTFNVNAEDGKRFKRNPYTVQEFKNCSVELRRGINNLNKVFKTEER